ncbi:hypothetical protein [Comamonas sp. HJ-2]
MATSTTYTVPEVPGSKRSSARAYTHAIVGCVNAEQRRLDAKSEEARKNHAKHWSYHAEGAQMKEGDLIHVQSYKPWSYPVTQERVDQHVAFMKENPTQDAYVQKSVDAQLKRINDAYGEGPAGPLDVLQWSQSAANAQKGLSSWKGLLGVRVVECVPVVKPARKSKRVESSPHEANNI